MPLTFTSAHGRYTARDNTKHYAVTREALGNVTTWSHTCSTCRVVVET